MSTFPPKSPWQYIVDMGEKLPIVSGKKLVEFFLIHGWKRHRQTSSHIILRKAGVAQRPLVVPNYREIAPDILLNNLRTADISREEFINHFRRRK